MLANNIANSSSSGFKADREFYSLYAAPEATSAASDPAQLPVIERHWTDFSQGALRMTGNPLDLALNGDGFFAASSPSGAVYTRNGVFHLSPGGELQTQDGYPVLGQDGKSIKLDRSKDVEFGPDGTVRQQGQVVSQLALVQFQDLTKLNKAGHAYFQSSDPDVKPGNAARIKVEQGAAEDANATPAEAAVRLVSVMRQFEMLQKALTLGVEMNRQAFAEVAKVGG